MARFTDKYAVITGAAKGISKASTLLMAQQGLKGAIIADMNEEMAKKTACEIYEKTGCICHAFKVDVSKPKDIEALFSFARETLPAVDILVNGAGIFPHISIEDLDAEKWDHCMNINLRGTHLCSREAVTMMKAQQYGRIINIASLAARIGGTTAVYSATKGGVIALTKSYAYQLGKYNITANCICPGIIHTDMTADRSWDSMIPQTPLGRLGEVGDVADLIAFLASDEAKYITGTSIDINGGYYMA